MAFSRLCFLALLVLLAREPYTTGYTSGYTYTYTKPVFPLASLNGSLIASVHSLASGNWASSGATCTDQYGDFPCSCLALSITKHTYVRSTYQPTIIVINTYPRFASDSDSISLRTTVTYGGNMVGTQYPYSGLSPPGDCCESCQVDSSNVRILFWPVDIDNTTAHNASQAGITKPYTTVSDGFTL